MTTTTDKLLQLAAAYESKAQALRLAAEELNGHEVGKAQSRINGKLAKAMALRGEGEPVVKRLKGTERQAAIREMLADGAQLPAREVAERLGLSSNYAQKVLREAGAQPTGIGQTSRWYLPAKRPQPARARARAARPARRGRRVGDPDKWTHVVELLAQARGPLSIKELRKLARAEGIDNLTGIHNYVRRGHIGMTGKGRRRRYVFKAPIEAAAAAPAAE